MQTGEAQQRFYEVRQREGRVSPEELDQIWAALEPVHIDEMIGSWKGSGFDTGHEGFRTLEKIRWYGKKFNSALDAKPLICHGENGELYSNVDLGKGEASLWMVEFRGEVTAAMVYDGMPVVDHFKRVDERTLMGIMNGKSDAIRDRYGRHFYFILDRI